MFQLSSFADDELHLFRKMYIKQFFNNQHSDIDWSQDILSNFYEKYIYLYTWGNDTLRIFILDILLHFVVLRFLEISMFARSTSINIYFNENQFFPYRMLFQSYTYVLHLKIICFKKLEDCYQSI